MQMPSPGKYGLTAWTTPPLCEIPTVRASFTLKYTSAGMLIGSPALPEYRPMASGTRIDSAPMGGTSVLNSGPPIPAAAGSMGAGSS